MDEQGSTELWQWFTLLWHCRNILAEAEAEKFRQSLPEVGIVEVILRPGQIRPANFRDPASTAHNPFDVGKADFKAGQREDQNPYFYDPHERVSGHWWHEHWILGFEAGQHEAEIEAERATSKERIADLRKQVAVNKRKARRATDHAEYLNMLVPKLWGQVEADQREIERWGGKVRR